MESFLAFLGVAISAALAYGVGMLVANGLVRTLKARSIEEPEPDAEPLLSRSQLLEQFKALRAAHTTATPATSVRGAGQAIETAPDPAFTRDAAPSRRLWAARIRQEDTTASPDATHHRL